MRGVLRPGAHPEAPPAARSRACDARAGLACAAAATFSSRSRCSAWWPPGSSCASWSGEAAADPAAEHLRSAERRGLLTGTSVADRHVGDLAGLLADPAAFFTTDQKLSDLATSTLKTIGSFEPGSTYSNPPGDTGRSVQFAFRTRDVGGVSLADFNFKFSAALVLDLPEQPGRPTGIRPGPWKRLGALWRGRPLAGRPRGLRRHRTDLRAPRVSVRQQRRGGDLAPPVGGHSATRSSTRRAIRCCRSRSRRS